ncbi:MAG: hypothetical protein NUV68_08035 [Caldiserica bacterium]|jgi:hypothetical protein|nr:hypothetical protein [Caldisericota bacterium]MDH7563232.1 hypothetical protein [Caldisericota bacterium]
MEKEKVDYDSIFALNRNNFAQKYLPVYQQFFTPRFIIQFRTLLPFNVPLHRGAFSILNENKTAHTFCFHNVKVEKPVDVSPDLKVKTVHVFVSKVEMALVSENVLEANDDEKISNHFDELLRGLNIFLLGYVIFTKDEDVCTVSKEMLIPVSLFRFVELPDWENSKAGLFIVHPNFPYPKEALEEETAKRILDYVHIVNRTKNPFVLSEELALLARRSLKNGLYREAVLYAQSNVENFLRTLLSQFLIRDGYDQASAASCLEEKTFKRMVQSEFHCRLDGKWNLEDENTEIGKWWRKTYELRNRIAHGGYFPSHEELILLSMLLNNSANMLFH